MIKLSQNEIEKLVCKYGTPLFVYDEKEIARRIKLMASSFKHSNFRILYSVKANSNIELLKIIRKSGCFIDASSPGDVFLATTAGFKSEEIYATGPNWTDDELEYFIKNKIFVFLDSLSHIRRVGLIKKGLKIGLRINPGIGCGFHKNVMAGGLDSKLGIPIMDFRKAVDLARNSGLIVSGLHFHIGSSCLNYKFFLEALERILSLANQIDTLEILDLGGGYGCNLHDEKNSFDIKKYGEKVIKTINNLYKSPKKIKLFIESGEFIMWPCACAITRVNTIKKNGPKKFIGVDLNSNHIPGPMLYSTYHPICNLSENQKLTREKINIAGNLCAAGDLLAKDRIMEKIEEGDILSIQNVGAYCTVRQSHFNSRLAVTELLKRKNGQFSVIKKETLKDLLNGQIYKKS